MAVRVLATRPSLWELWRDQHPFILVTWASIPEEGFPGMDRPGVRVKLAEPESWELHPFLAVGY